MNDTVRHHPQRLFGISVNKWHFISGLLLYNGYGSSLVPRSLADSEPRRLEGISFPLTPDVDARRARAWAASLTRTSNPPLGTSSSESDASISSRIAGMVLATPFEGLVGSVGGGGMRFAAGSEVLPGTGDRTFPSMM
jgi:hypothetical protein